MMSDYNKYEIKQIDDQFITELLITQLIEF